MLHSDVIAAISTPPGKGGVAVIRMSGEGALLLAERVFSAMSGRAISSYPPRTQIYGYVLDSGEKIDDGMLTYFEENASYTGEQTVEISCHGGILVTELVLAAVLSAGARLAEAGEFTRRAFLNGRLSLSEAEAIGLLLDAKSEEQIRLASKDSRERLTLAIGALSAKLTELLGSVYARIDYPDEDLGDFTDAETLEILKGALSDTERLLSTYKEGHSIAEGITTAIVGCPNVGKSTIYNLLSGREAAIVTDIAGTTRDVLENTVSLGRVMLRLSDTAGIRSEGAADEVEKIGIARSKERLGSCELVLAVFDASESSSLDSLLLDEISRSPAVKIAIYNKIDKKQPDTDKLPCEFDKVLYLSARENPDAARGAIRAAVEELFCDGKISLSDRAVIHSARQRAELTEARDAISSAIEALLAGVFTDAVSSDVEIALGAISRVDGRAVSEAVVDNIFSRFCVGK
ncbi:MAG: tRNA uridine-5-carboxymethylaminomethyl(34) synthesis GTPase MnmE [Clostridia bacterium]|nr:tRNA uridine-5-carboxymethylaminomethyl(34) synthesis GTPase MnmE [Clostridia bacterium]